MAGQSKPIVLVVEDEPLLRMMAVDLVEEAGLAALEAAEATEAVEILERRGDIRVVFTDIDMPRGMDGLSLAAWTRARWPSIEIVITSGHIRPSAEQMPERCLFFSKPFRMGEVQDAIRKFAQHES